MDQKIANVLTIPYNDSSIKHALSVLESPQFADISDRTLLDGVESSILEQVGSILRDFDPMYTALKDLGTHIDSCSSELRGIDAAVANISKSFGPLLKESNMLNAEQKYLETKLTTASAFAASFHISEKERTSLCSPGPVTDEFYRVFDKITAIKSNCLELMAETPELGESLLTEMTRMHKAAYENLRLKIESSLRSGDEDLRAIRPDLKLLSQEPFLFKSVLGHICDVRKQAVKREFQRLGPSDDDPERVVGVECASLHSVLINEYDLFRGLLSTQESDDFAFTLFSANNSEDLIYELVDSIFQGIEPLFKQRLNQLISVQRKIIALDSVHNVLEFYKETFEKHKQPTMSKCLAGLSDSITAQFKHLLLVEIDKAKRGKIPRDLNAPDFIYSMLQLLRKLCLNYENSLNYQPLGDSYIKGRISDMIDPFVAQCETLSASQDAYTRHIFLLNVLEPIKLELTGNVFANFKIDEIEASIGAHRDELVDLEYAELLRESGLTEFRDDAARLNGAIDKFLVEAGEGTERRLRAVKSPSLGAEVEKGAKEKWLEEYAKVDGVRSVEEVRVLLS